MKQKERTSNQIRMIRTGNICFRAVLVMLVCQTVFHNTYAQQLWSEVRFNKSQVYIGEPLEVTVSVFTSTWFTSGVDPGNVKVNGAYTVFFRNVSTSRNQGGKTYSGVEMIYNVFPFVDRNIEFPVIEIEVESPPDGGYKGKTHLVKTDAREIKVRPVPPGFTLDQWLVTGNLSVDEKWSGDLDDVKVGDVITRTINRYASNTVSQLIPPVMWDSIPGVSMYPTRNSVESNRSKTAISASRTESMRYLLEKEGIVNFPEMVFTWWNPYQQKLYKRTLSAVNIDVQPNPNLGMLATVRDSLSKAMIDEDSEDEEKKSFLIMGISPKSFVLFCLIVALSLYLIVMLVKTFIRIYKKRKAEYLQSEKYYFDQFRKAMRTGNRKQVVQSMYLWLDQLELDEPSANYFAANFGSYKLIEEVNSLMETSDLVDIALSEKDWEEARMTYKKGKPGYAQDIKYEWINP